MAAAAETALHFARIINACALENKNVLDIHPVVLDAEHFGNVHDLAASVLKARNLHHQFHGAGKLLQDDAGGDFKVRHQDHGFQPRKRILGIVGVDCSHGAFDAGVHCLQHIQRFGAAALTDDDAVRTHAERRAYQLALIDAAFFVQVGRPRFEFHYVPLLQLQLGGIFDGDDALVLGDEPRECVQGGGLTGTGSARDQNGCLRLHAGGQKLQHAGHDGLVFDHLVRGDDVAAEAADAERRAVERERRDDGIDARSIGQAGVHNWLRFIDAPAHLRHDFFDDVHQVSVVLKTNLGLHQLAVAFDVDLVETVHQNIGDGRFFQ